MLWMWSSVFFYNGSGSNECKTLKKKVYWVFQHKNEGYNFRKNIQKMCERMWRVKGVFFILSVHPEIFFNVILSLVDFINNETMFYCTNIILYIQNFCYFLI